MVVVGGGITGAGVALDAATRGYSVALVERADYASGTSSRSSKLVHGGLRYLQNFDLGLVREALLERQINVKLAPAPGQAAAARRRRLRRSAPRPPDRGGPEPLRRHVRRQAPPRRPCAARRPARSTGRSRSPTSTGTAWPTGRPTATGSSRGRRSSSGCPRWPVASRPRATCSTTARPTTSRLVLTVLQEAERFGAVCCNGLEVTDLLDAGGRSRGVQVTDVMGGDRSRSTPRTSSTRPASGPTACARSELHDEAEVPVIKPSRGTHITLRHDQLPLARGAIVPAGGGRTIFALPWLGGTLIGTTDTEVEPTRPAPARPRRARAARTSRTCSTPPTRTSAPR